MRRERKHTVLSILLLTVLVSSLAVLSSTLETTVSSGAQVREASQRVLEHVDEPTASARTWVVDDKSSDLNSTEPVLAAAVVPQSTGDKEEEAQEVQARGRQLQCSGYWNAYSACKGGKKCRTYVSTYKPYVYTPIKIPPVSSFTLNIPPNAWSPYMSPLSGWGPYQQMGWNYGSYKYGRRSLQCTPTGEKQCTTTGCAQPVNCAGYWGGYGGCHKGKKCRMYVVTKHAQNGGAGCPYSNGQYDCTTSGCPQPVHCSGYWSGFGSCSGGQKCRSWVMTQHASNGGSCSYHAGQKDCTQSGCPQPVHCSGYWGGYGGCHRSGSQSVRCKKYTVTKHAAHGGSGCGASNGQQSCTTSGCTQPVHCSGFWGSFGGCHKSGSQNVRCRKYKVTKNPAHGGDGCGAHNGQNSCTTSGCTQPTNCAGSFGSYGSCYYDSGNHRNLRCKTYKVTQNAANNGAGCPYSNNYKSCTTSGCSQPVNCVGAWGGYGSCYHDSANHRNLRCRHYTYSKNAAHNGHGCPYSNNYKQCTTSGCSQPVNCVGAWGGYGSCYHDSANKRNLRCRYYTYSKSAAHNGYGCPYSNNYKQCTTSGCAQPVNCVGAWGGYGSCYHDSANHRNLRCRYYTYSKSAAHNGYGCPYSNNYKQCTTSGCSQPVNCVGAWGGYGSCYHDSKDHKNRRCRHYTYSKSAAHNGYGCPYSNNYKQCTTSGCSQPVDCAGSWGAYGSCYNNPSNKKNYRCRYYKYNTNAAHNGYGCPYSNNYKQCTQSGCAQPVNCVGGWLAYGSCYHDSKDHKNRRCRYYKVATNAGNWGIGCPYSNMYKQCITSGCSQPVDCVGAWDPYGSCYHDSSVHKNKRCRYYKISKAAAHNGYGCPHTNNFKFCTTLGCGQPGNCVGGFGAYGSCFHDSKDHKNRRCRTYTITSNAANNGYGCAYSNNYKQCTTSGCAQPVDCAGGWLAYGPCYHDSKDHKNRRCRYYKVNTNPAHSGYGCPYSNMYKQCTTGGCAQPVDCAGSWGAYSSCSTSSGKVGKGGGHGGGHGGGIGIEEIEDVGGIGGSGGMANHLRRSLMATPASQRCRTYSISTNAAHNGYSCPYSNNYEQCTQSGCAQPVDCIGGWKAYGSCKHDSFIHKNKRCRNYEITRAAANGGYVCPFADNQEQCTFQSCSQPKDCVGAWGNYDACHYDEKDHENERCRVYSVSQGAMHNGYACSHANNLRHCTKSGCGQPVDCEGEWGDYGSCVHDANKHQNKRCKSYTVTTMPATNGKSCPYTHMQLSCMTSGCAQPVDCAGSWLAYGSCKYDSKDHKNKKCRSYKYSTNAIHNGKACPHENNAEQCITSGCAQPVNCVGAWDSYGSCFHDSDDHKNRRCRYYKYSTNAANSGYGCPYSNNYKQCTTSGCAQPVDCAGGWLAYGPCYHDSQDHKNRRCRYYKVNTNPAHSGYGCPYSNMYKQCTTGGCAQPVDCVGSWGAYSTCAWQPAGSATGSGNVGKGGGQGGGHGGGIGIEEIEDIGGISGSGNMLNHLRRSLKATMTNQRCRTYSISVQPSNNGYSCPFTHDFTQCTMEGCVQAVDCVGSWGAYGSCKHDSADHKNKKCRSYKISVKAENGGVACPQKNGDESCTVLGCVQPVDCVGSWGAYDACKHDGQGHKNKRCRKYNIAVASSNSGYGCPHQSGYIACTTSGCAQPVDCAGSWLPYGACFHDSKDHKNRRCKVYKISTNAANNGYGCPYTNTYKSCTTSGCAQPVDCLGEWGAYSSCAYAGLAKMTDKVLENTGLNGLSGFVLSEFDSQYLPGIIPTRRLLAGTHKNERCRTYSVTRKSSNNGYNCPYADGYNSCTTSQCSQPIDCKGTWESYSACKYKEDEHVNIKCKNYKITTQAAFNGYVCPYSQGYETCTKSGCSQPADCVGAWGNYGNCVHEPTVHKNKRCRSYTITSAAAHNGKKCPSANNAKQCTFQSCAQPVNCVGGWLAYGSCYHDSKDHKNRRCKYYKISTSAAHNGYGCPYANNYKSCTTSGCSQPVDCAGSWLAYGSCFHSSLDHKNRRCRFYKVSTNAAHNGYGCAYSNNFKQCTTSGCTQPVDCLGSWDAYGPCLHKQSNNNERCRLYKVTRKPEHSGYDCPYSNDYQSCTASGCAQPVDCVGMWNAYGDCKYESDKHINKRCKTYSIVSQEKFNGSGCPYSSGHSSCTTSGCAQPVDCVGSWGNYDACHYEEADHENERCRIYSVSQVAMHNGFACPHKDQLKHCTKSGCGQPVDCEGEWTVYSSCHNVKELPDLIDIDEGSDELPSGGLPSGGVGQIGGGGGGGSGNPTLLEELDGKDMPLVEDNKILDNKLRRSLLAGGNKNQRCRTYKVTTKADLNGKKCPFENNKVECITEGCSQPVNCVGDWGSYSSCKHDTSDHKNRRCRTYSVSTNAAHNGHGCPYADSYVQCTTSGCAQPVDCAGAWGYYGSCSHDAKNHKNKKCRHYMYSVSASHNGYNCPYSNNYKQCTTSGCSQPVNCVGDWDAYGPCNHDTSDHKNRKCRYYKIATNAAHNGYGCAYANNYKSCTTSGCPQPVDCVGSWAAYGECKTVPGKMTGDIGILPADDADKLIDFADEESFNNFVGPQPNQRRLLSSLLQNKRCRTYGISVQPSNNGYSCPFTHDFTQCTVEGCAQPVDCVGSWDAYGSCKHDKADHKNKKCRSYKISVKAENGGLVCPQKNGDESCTVFGCVQPVDCVGSWDAYGPCKHDGQGHQNKRCRKYNIAVASSNNGYGCPYTLGSKQCTTSGCAQPVDCIGGWSQYSYCKYNNVLHHNEKCRKYVVDRPASNNGYECAYADNFQQCSKEGCAQPVDCAGAWDAYGSCEHDGQIHKNKRCRLYKVAVAAAHNGHACPYTNAFKQCTFQSCSQPVDCVGSWGSYDACHYDESDHENERCRIYSVSQVAMHNGYACPHKDQLKHCTKSGCGQPVDCEGEWTVYSSCHYAGLPQLPDLIDIGEGSDGLPSSGLPSGGVGQMGGGGGGGSGNPFLLEELDGKDMPLVEDNKILNNQHRRSLLAGGHKNQRCRTYKVTTESELGGKSCPVENGEVQCITEGCSQPVDCAGGWGAYGACKHDSSEHKNKRCRVYAVSTNAAHNGFGCPYADSYKQCTTVGCAQPVDCLGEWNEYSVCKHDKLVHKNKKCRTYTVTRASSSNGYECAFADSYIQCTVFGCAQPTDCLGAWGDYSQCAYEALSKRNTRCRIYSVSIANQNNGNSCPFPNNFEQCTKETCAQPIDCVGAWSQYDSCEHDSDTHTNKRCRVYKVAVAAAHNGQGCPYTNAFEQCTTEECAQPVDCVGAWGNYDACHYEEKDHENERCRVYSVSQVARFNGFACPHEDQLKHCTKSGCGQPVDCEGEWTVYSSCHYAGLPQLPDFPIDIGEGSDGLPSSGLPSGGVNQIGGGGGGGSGNPTLLEELDGKDMPLVEDNKILDNKLRRSLLAGDHKNQRCRTYKVTTKADLNGKKCPFENNKVECITEGCNQPVDCVGDWGSYSSCKHDTSDHKNRRCRTYSVSTNAAHNGHGCPYTTNYVQCTTEGCAQPVDCIGAWNVYGSCTHDENIHKNKRCRTYAVERAAAHNGYACPFADSYMQCTFQSCSQPVDCVGSWGSYDACHYDESDHENERCRVYSVSQVAMHNGYSCPHADKLKTCTKSGCGQPVDCEGEWTVYSSCHYAGLNKLLDPTLLDVNEGLPSGGLGFANATLADLDMPQLRRSLLAGDHKNERCRTYKVTTKADLSGKSCPHKDGKVDCITEGCSQPVDCVGDWGSYSSCKHDTSDHKNRRCRTYSVSTNAAHNGHGCPYANTYEQCTTEGCAQPVDCVGNWKAYGACVHDSKDHKNKRCRNYEVVVAEKHNGYSCPFSDSYMQCTSFGCAQPVDCLGGWDETSYEICKHDLSTKKNKRCRTYVVTRESEHNGYECGFAHLYSQCKTQGCAQPVDCVGAWDAYGSCKHDSTTHKNKRCRVYKVAVAAAHNGQGCPYTNAFEQCTTEECAQPVDCVGAWGNYDACNYVEDDHKNERCRVYSVSQVARFNGYACPHEDQLKHCTKSGCGQPVDCEGEWTVYSSCHYAGLPQLPDFPIDIGEGSDELPSSGLPSGGVGQMGGGGGGGSGNPTLLEELDGKDMPLVEDNKILNNQHRRSLLAGDHKNQRCRTYKVTTKADLNGKKCPFENNKVECITGGCNQPVDCVGEWMEGACYHDSSDHQNKRCRTYSIITNAAYNGQGCPYAQAHVDCRTDGCVQPVDCIGDWNAYGPCFYDNMQHKNKKCRSYSISRSAAHNGYSCPFTDNYSQCTSAETACEQPKDCVGSWGQYESCFFDKEYKRNIRCKTYGITAVAQFNGIGCPYTNQYEHCTELGCAQPVDCVGAWGNYDACHYEEADHENERCRIYSVSQVAMHNGFACPHEDQLKHCTKSGCGQPVDCEGEWTVYSSCHHAGFKKQMEAALGIDTQSGGIANATLADLDMPQLRRSLLAGDHKNERCRTYQVTTKADLNGKKCPFENNKVECITEGCSQPVDCVGDWGSYSSCKHDTNDHKNRRCRTYTISTNAAHNGHGCPYMTSYVQCTTEGCAQPVDCIGEWNTYGACSYDESNHKNKRCRTYAITRASEHNGYACAFADNYMQCIHSGCVQPVDCLGAWDQYDSCEYDESAHKNKRCRLYKVAVAAAHNGHACPYTNAFEQCTNEQCAQPVDCVGSWGNYDACKYNGASHSNKKCRMYNVDVEAKYNGFECPYAHEEVHCTKSGCGQPVDCEGEWTGYGTCNHAGGKVISVSNSGLQILNDATLGELPQIDEVASNELALDPVTRRLLTSGHVNERCRTYKVTTKAELGGKSCPVDSGVVQCITEGCSQPVDCAGGWGAYGACKHDTNDHKNRRCRVYAILTTAAHNGFGCPYADSYKQCTTDGCAQPVDCLGEWSEYGPCRYEETSHANDKCRTYAITRPSAHNGYACPYADSYMQCTVSGCEQPVDCVGAWDQYGSCKHDTNAHKNKRCRLYKVAVAAAHNGHACPYANAFEQCTSEQCAQPVDCVGSWGNYDACNYVEDDHKNERCRVYSVSQVAMHNGFACPHADNLQHCTKSGCGQPVDCEGDWTVYSSCHYAKELLDLNPILFDSSEGSDELPSGGLPSGGVGQIGGGGGGGSGNPTLLEELDGKAMPLGDLDNKLRRSLLAGDHKNQRCRTYKVTTKADLNGKKCPFANNKVECITEGCSQPVDCVGDWGAFGECYHDTVQHKNKRCRTYTISTNAAHNGFGCPYTSSYIQCTTEGCGQPVDCIGEWNTYGACSYDESNHKNKRCRTYAITRASEHNGYACAFADNYMQCIHSGCVQPVDCLGAWDQYDSCEYDESAHKNKRCRLYKVAVAAAHNGHACPYTNAFEQCTNEQCAQPVDCVGAWGNYGACHYEEEDHENERCRVYSVSQVARFNGFACPHEDQLKHCTKSGCGQPVDCEGEWTPYGSCAHVADGHKNERCRTYQVTTKADLSGKKCPFENNKVDCITEGCSQPVDCAGDWGAYGTCYHDSNDHKNRRCRVYAVSTNAAHNGYGCPYAQAYKQCTTEGCGQPVDCVGEWNEYDSCFYEASEHKNKRCRTYAITRASEHNGYACAFAENYMQCTLVGCAQPVDCLGAWDQYDSCAYDKDAHKNKRCRLYKVEVAAANNGHTCPYTNAFKQCTNEQCAQPVDCVGSWSNYDACNYVEDDHKNERCRVYSVSQVAMHNGFACPHADNLKTCTKSGCGQPVDCEGEWAPYGSCAHVEDGHKNERCRTYQVTTKADLNGKKCPFENNKVDCVTEGCSQPVDCVGDWGLYSACNYDADDHMNRRCRVYAVSTMAAHNGYGCPYAQSYKQCTTEGCAQPVDCIGDWKEYGVCSHDKFNHKNKRCRTFAISRKAEHGGYACQYIDNFEQCTLTGCAQPVDCVGVWDTYKDCAYDAAAHKNKRCRLYKVVTFPSNNGHQCLQEHNYEQCVHEGCAQPVDCVGAWDQYDSCEYDSEFHKNKRCRLYRVAVAAAHNGHACPYTNTFKQCTNEECAQPVDCVGSWGNYDTCHYEGVGHENERCRVYSVSQVALNNGYACPHADNLQHCTKSGCGQPVDCEGEWTVYSSCNHVAGDHKNERCRTFEVTTKADLNGKTCPHKDGKVDCITEGCSQPVDCAGDWGSYSACKYDDNDHKNRRCRLYLVTTNAAHNGYGCPYAQSYKQCTTEGCAQPVDCIGDWEEYELCQYDTLNHQNQRCRTYAITRPSAHNGYECAFADSYMQCTVSGCEQPVDCAGVWGEYDSCEHDTDAHKNKRCRLYKVEVAAAHNGHACPYANTFKQCTNEQCAQPVDCVGSWGNYDACNYVEDGHKNERCRVYSVSQVALNNGYACPHADNLQHCTKSGCGQPVDCEGDWTVYSSCNHVAGDHKNQRCRTFEVTTKADLNGKKCPFENNKVECITEGCSQPVDCVGGWGAYGTCFHDINDHKNRRCRTYTISTNAAHNGYGCPYTSSFVQCTTEGCGQPVDCIGEWKAYGACSYDESNHKNKRCRTYAITRASEHNGYACPFVESYQQCVTSSCEQPVDCLGSWDEYSFCAHDSNDHTNKRCRKFNVVIPDKNNGLGCKYTDGHEECTNEQCAQPVDCVGSWGNYDTCHYEGVGHENERCRVYSVSQVAMHNGFACPHADNLQHCTKSGCGQPVDCEGEWQPFGACSYDKSSHTSSKCRKYLVSVEADLNGKKCDHANEEVQCETEGCSQPVDCVGTWKDYSSCFHDSENHTNKKCRNYAVSVEAAHSGYGCPFKNQFQECTKEGCAQPVDCIGQWETYGPCNYDQADHTNKKCRTYAIVQTAAQNGYLCPHNDQHIQCTKEGCAQPVDCVGAWDAYGSCAYDTDAHKNKKCRLYKVAVAAAHNGHACPYTNAFKQCTDAGCAQPVDCVGSWGNYDACNYVEDGHKNERCRVYSVSQVALNNGYACPHADNLQHCTKSGCGQPVDCEGDWTVYSSCNHVAGEHKNERCRTFEVTTKADLNGKTCPHKDGKVDCVTEGCSQPVDCAGDWGAYGTCFHDNQDHQNRRCRVYAVSTIAAHNGYGCPYAQSYKQCTTEGCAQPVDCIGDWKEYGVCSHDESDHKNKRCRTYAITRALAHNGYACPYDDNYEQCTSIGCTQPVDCVGAWDQYDSCEYDESAHDTKRCRLYRVAVAAAHNGHACPYTDEFKQCTNEECAQPVDCVGDWVDQSSECFYDELTKKNTMCKKFVVTTENAHDGKECEHQNNELSCSSSECEEPVDCFGQWLDYGECQFNADAGLTTRCRSYNVVNFAKHNGKECPYSQDFESCTTNGCEQSSGSNSTLVTDDDDSTSDSSDQSSEDGRSSEDSDVSASTEGGSLDSEEDEEASVSTASAAGMMIGVIGGVAVCCMMGLAFVYVRQKRKRQAEGPGAQYQTVGQESNIFSQRNQSMLLMNPMFSSAGKSRKSTIAMKSGARMSFLSNPLFDTSEDSVDIPDSPNGSDAEAELLAHDSIAKQSAYDNPLYSTSRKYGAPQSEASFDESIASLGKEFEASFSAINECMVEHSAEKDMLEVAMHTWHEIEADMAEATSNDVEVMEVNSEKLLELKHSLNKIEQGALLNGKMSISEKNNFMAVLNQARSKLRHVESTVKRKQTAKAESEAPAQPEWVGVRNKLKAIAKFKTSNPLAK